MVRVRVRIRVSVHAIPEPDGEWCIESGDGEWCMARGELQRGQGVRVTVAVEESPEGAVVQEGTGHAVGLQVPKVEVC